MTTWHSEKTPNVEYEGCLHKYIDFSLSVQYKPRLSTTVQRGKDEQRSASLLSKSHQTRPFIFFSLLPAAHLHKNTEFTRRSSGVCG
jgi:hypothetical protein